MSGFAISPSAFAVFCLVLHFKCKSRFPESVRFTGFSSISVMTSLVSRRGLEEEAVLRVLGLLQVQQGGRLVRPNKRQGPQMSRGNAPIPA